MNKHKIIKLTSSRTDAFTKQEEEYFDVKLIIVSW